MRPHDRVRLPPWRRPCCCPGSNRGRFVEDEVCFRFTTAAFGSVTQTTCRCRQPESNRRPRFEGPECLPLHHGGECRSPFIPEGLKPSATMGDPVSDEDKDQLDESDFMSQLALAEIGDLKSRIEALRELSNTSLYWIPTANAADVFNRLMFLASDPAVQVPALHGLAAQVADLASPGETFPVGYRDRLTDHFLWYSKEEEKRTSYTATICLGVVGRAIPVARWEDLVSYLLNQSRNRKRGLRMAAARALGQLGSYSPREPPFNRNISVIPEHLTGAVVLRLLELTADPEWPVACRATTALGMMEDTIPDAHRRMVLDRILGLLSHPTPKLRDAAIFSAAKIDWMILDKDLPLFAGRLLDLAKDVDPEVRASALCSWFWGYERVPDSYRVQAVRNALKVATHGDDPVLRRSAMLLFSSGNLRDCMPTIVMPDIVASMLELLGDADVDVSRGAYTTLTFYQSKIPLETRSEVDRAISQWSRVS